MEVCMGARCDSGTNRAIAINLNERGDHIIATCLSNSDELRALGFPTEPNI